MAKPRNTGVSGSSQAKSLGLSSLQASLHLLRNVLVQGSRTYKSPEELVKIQIWIQWIWGGDQASAFLTISQVIQMICSRETTGF